MLDARALLEHDPVVEQVEDAVPFDTDQLVHGPERTFADSFARHEPTADAASEHVTNGLKCSKETIIRVT